jgi:protein-S-isoprenylcysteine O-methyltransferase Ste14
MGTETAGTGESKGIDRHSDPVVRVGAWLFKQRTWLPLPIVAVLLLAPADPVSPFVLACGVALVAGGELLRLWAVRHIGVVSRTRSHRTGPLVSSGPYLHVRNPLYLGNIALWAGFGVSAGLAWLAPAFVLAFGAVYHAIVRWEETLLAARLGEGYRSYAERVPRWWPSPRVPGADPRAREAASQFSWRETLFSERGTLLAIAAGFALLWIKSRLAARF